MRHTGGGDSPRTMRCSTRSGLSAVSSAVNFFTSSRPDSHGTTSRCCAIRNAQISMLWKRTFHDTFFCFEHAFSV